MISSSVGLAMLVEVSREPILIACPPQLPPVVARHTVFIPSLKVMSYKILKPYRLGHRNRKELE